MTRRASSPKEPVVYTQEWLDDYNARQGKPVQPKKVVIHASEHEEQKCVIEWAELNKVRWP